MWLSRRAGSHNRTLFVLLSAAAIAGGTIPARAAMPMVSAHGDQFYADGEPITLRGCNLGCWLLFEPWMQGWNYPDQYTVSQILIKRFGKTEERKLMHTYRANFIRNRDFKLIRQFHFNIVRVPFNYQRLEHTHPPYALRRHPFYWLDRAVRLAAKSHIYVILDMHGAPGRQSIDNPTGRRNRDLLWKSAEDQHRYIALWRLIARHFSDNTDVMGYDLLNEPYGNFSENMAPKLLRLMPRVYTAVRSVDSHHIMFMPNLLSGSVRFWGSPASHGWRNVAYTSHFYPGLFGAAPGLVTMAHFMKWRLPHFEAFLRSVKTPFLVGEFNAVLNENGGPAMMRYEYDTFARYHWAATMWAYKLVKPQAGATDNSWYMVSNKNPLPAISLRRSSLSAIMAYCKSMGTIPLAINRPLLSALTSKDAPPLALPDIGPPPVFPSSAPHHIAMRGWKQADIGGARRGGQKLTTAVLEVFGSGSDIFNQHDSFHYLYTRAAGNVTMTTTVRSLLWSSMYAKAGIMLRASNRSNSAFAMVNVFPTGSIAWVCRKKTGGGTNQNLASASQFPIQIRLTRHAGIVAGYYRTKGHLWVKLGSTRATQVVSAGHIGLAVSSHNPAVLTSADFSDIRLKDQHGQVEFAAAKSGSKPDAKLETAATIGHRPG